MTKRLPVCLTYALLQLGQVSLYTPDSENLLGVGFLWESRFPIVFVVWNAILSFVFRTNFRNFPTTHRIHTLSTPDTQTQNYKLLLICGRHFTNIRLQTYQHTDDPWWLYALHPKLQFTAEAERDHNYHDISIHRTPTNVKTAIYRKPTFTDTIIPYTSNHPTQHKYAVVGFLFNRIDSYNLQQEEYQHELNIIHNILHNNAFPIKPHKPPTHAPTRPSAPQKTKQKRTSFTYMGKETSYIIAC